MRVGGPRRGVFSPLHRSSDEEPESPTQPEAPSPQLALHLAQGMRPGLPESGGVQTTPLLPPRFSEPLDAPHPPVKTRATTLPSHLLPGGLRVTPGTERPGFYLRASVTLGHCSGSLS